MSERVGVRKTYKIYLNGAFVRSDSGRTEQVGGENVVRGSRKDVRDAVVAARAAHEKWAAQTPGNRGLVLYRLAEMMEARAGGLAEQLVLGGTVDADAARREVEAAIDRTVWYAGWCDKYVALASARNPVSGPHFNFSTTEPAGVIGVIAPDAPALLGLVTAVLPTLVSGNAVIAVASERDPRTAVVFAECLATSDLPGGVCNVITGTRAELGPALAGHMDVDGLHAFGIGREAEVALGELAAESVTRTRFEDAPRAKAWYKPAYDDLDRVLAFTELKTIWHPARI
ncbi:MAG TPA: aldehyde dehydrogenase family protein [Candidatus Lustribacter sp.]|nr:aldehyde dehydrogenase family protein [Candidatus Lustribacter sp.]